MKRRSWIGSIVLIVTLLGIGVCLAAWKYAAIQGAAASAANQPEPIEAVTVAVARTLEYRSEATSIGTVLALKSITLRNEVPGTVEQVMLTPGQIVEPGALLVALDVSVEKAELRAQEAQAALAETQLARMQRAGEGRAVSETEVDRARAERDVAIAQIARTKAIIDRKTIRAPFRARVGMADVHPGQYLVEGTLLTTLQGVDNAVHVDFTVAQHVAAGMREGDHVVIVTSAETPPVAATIIAVDARIDQVTRNTMVRARIESNGDAPRPGASVRVRIPVGSTRNVVAIPVSALRKGPDGDHVFVIATDAEGNDRASVRAVRSGTMIGDEIVVFEGLTEGDRVAASGSFKLREGVRIGIAGESIPPKDTNQ